MVGREWTDLVSVCVCVCVVGLRRSEGNGDGEGWNHSLNFIGFFMEPTIFTNVEDENFIAKEESFGPVMIISIFENG